MREDSNRQQEENATLNVIDYLLCFSFSCKVRYIISRYESRIDIVVFN